VRPVPPGLSKRDEKILRKIRKRAHYLDKGMNLCGFRVGWTFWIGFIPVAGDIIDALLNYGLVIKPAQKLDIPQDLLAKMLFNNAISAGLGFVPVAGDVALAVWKANSRNAHLIETFLAIRGQEQLASHGQAQSVIQQHNGGGHGALAEIIGIFKPGAGMNGSNSAQTTAPAVTGRSSSVAPAPMPPSKGPTKRRWLGGS